MKTMAAASSGMAAQSARLRLSSENIANVDTPGYRRKLVSFQQLAQPGGGVVSAGRVRLDQSPLPKTYDPSHPLADEQGYFEGSTVDLMVELADAREAQRSYEANLKMMDQARSMTTGLLELLRR
ncbi:MAG: flagellar basal-body rod protein FlgC [Paracoccaceae bacterium]|jgi:flagellar basal-body rod protein FlgC